MVYSRSMRNWSSEVVRSTTWRGAVFVLAASLVFSGIGSAMGCVCECCKTDNPYLPQAQFVAAASSCEIDATVLDTDCQCNITCSETLPTPLIEQPAASVERATTPLPFVQECTITSFRFNDPLPCSHLRWGPCFSSSIQARHCCLLC